MPKGGKAKKGGVRGGGKRGPRLNILTMLEKLETASRELVADLQSGRANPDDYCVVLVRNSTGDGMGFTSVDLATEQSVVVRVTLNTLGKYIKSNLNESGGLCAVCLKTFSNQKPQLQVLFPVKRQSFGMWKTLALPIKEGNELDAIFYRGEGDADGGGGGGEEEGETGEDDSDDEDVDMDKL